MSAEYKICLQQSIRVDGLETSREEIDRLLGDWRDGRYPFYVEAIQISMASIVDTAIRLVVDRSARKEFGDEMVKVGPGSETSRAHLETEKILRDLTINCVSDCRALSATTIIEHELLPDSKWRVLSRDDRKLDGAPGDYTMSSRIFSNADDARLYANGISCSLFPIIVEALKADAVLGALNLKDRRES